MLRTLVIRSFEGVTRFTGGGNRLLVLGYHRVLGALDPLYPGHPERHQFRRQMRTLCEDFHVLPLQDALDRLAGGNLPPAAVSITFDDGYADNFANALPVLQELHLPATFFVATGYLDGGVMFNDCVLEACRRVPAGEWDTRVAELGVVRVPETSARTAFAYELIRRIKYIADARRMEAALTLLRAADAEPPKGLMMSRQQVAGLHAAGMAIGAHTRGHPILRLLDAQLVEREIAQGKGDLEDIIGQPVALFAYPNGNPDRDYGAREVAILRRLGFKWAVTTAYGYADARHDRLQIPRVDAWGGSGWAFARSLALARRSPRGKVCCDETAASLLGTPSASSPRRGAING